MIVQPAEAHAPADDLLLRRACHAGNRLVRSGAVWLLLAGEGDRRRRPRQTLCDDDVQRLVKEGWVAPCGAGQQAPTPEGIAAARRLRDAPGADRSFLHALAPREARAESALASLARLAARNGGPRLRRACRAGARLLAEAECALGGLAGRMNWDGVAGASRPKTGAAPPEHRILTARRALERVRREAGETVFALAWSACVEGLSVFRLETRHALPRGTGLMRLREALAALADAFDGLAAAE